MFTMMESFYLLLVPGAMIAFAAVVGAVSVLSRGPFTGLRDLAPPARTDAAPHHPRKAA